jgi:hypothetical protein
MANGSPGLYVISGANLQAQKILVKFKYVITLEKIEVDNPPRPLSIALFSSGMMRITRPGQADKAPIS